MKVHFYLSSVHRDSVFLSCIILKMSILFMSIKESKITPGVCPGTKQTNPLMPIGGHPAYTMVSQGLSWDWWGRSQVLRLGFERQQVMCQQSFLQFKYKGNILQTNSNYFSVWSLFRLLF